MNPFEAKTLQDWYLSFDEVIFLDVESFYSKDFSLTKMTTTEYIMDDQFYLQSIAMTEPTGDISYYPEDQLDAAIGHMQTLTREGKKWMLVAHNCKFDAAVLKWRYGIEPTWFGDTMAMAAAIFTGCRTNLKMVCEYLWPDDEEMRKGTELVQFKGFRELSDEQHAAMKGYNIQDVFLCASIFNKLLQFIPLSELYQIHMTVRMYVNPSFVVDRGLMAECIEDERNELQALETTALKKLETIKHDINYPIDRKLVTSNPRFEQVLKAFDIPIPMKLNAKRQEAPAFGKKDVAWIDLRTHYPEYDWLFNFRERAKSTIALTRAERFLSCSKTPPHFMPVPLRYYGAHTGRLSGEDKINLQNLQRGSRHRYALKAAEGYNIHVTDLSNIEARVVAWLADQEDLINDFRNGVDVYSKFSGEIIYNYPVNKGMKTERQVGKQCILGLGYGMGWKTYKNALLSGPMGAPPIPCDDNFAKKCTYGYRERYPMIPQAWRLCDKFIKLMMDKDADLEWKGMRIQHEKIILPNGLALRYPKLRTEYNDGGDYCDPSQRTVYWNGKFWKNLYGGLLFENISQALAACILKEQMETIDRFVVGIGVGQVCLQVHDEIIMSCRNDHALYPDDLQTFMEREMSTAKGWYKDIPIDCEGSYGATYGDAK
jgi:DNA polymerase